MGGGGKPKKDKGAEKRAEEERELMREQARMLQRALDQQSSESATLKQALDMQIQAGNEQFDVLQQQNLMLQQQAAEYEGTINEMLASQEKATAEGNVLANTQSIMAGEEKESAMNPLALLSGKQQQRGLLASTVKLTSPKTVTQAERRGSLLGGAFVQGEGVPR